MMDFSWIQMGQVLLAALLGGVLGVEREWRGQSAGVRTNMLISLSSCLFTILSIHAFPGTPRDTARVAAQIVTGVGFLGAGTLLHKREHVKGLTTAATIWLVAALGMAVGAGGHILAIFTTALAVCVLRLLPPLTKRLPRQNNGGAVQEFSVKKGKKELAQTKAPEQLNSEM